MKRDFWGIDGEIWGWNRYIISNFQKRVLKNTPCKIGQMFKRKGGGSKAFWTMLKKTALFLMDGFPYHVPGGRRSHSDGRRPRRMDTSAQVLTSSTWHQHHDIIIIILVIIITSILVILIIIISFHHNGQDFVGAVVERRDTCQLRTCSGWPRRSLSGGVIRNLPLKVFSDLCWSQNQNFP